jgi:hypothetical protein
MDILMKSNVSQDFASCFAVQFQYGFGFFLPDVILIFWGFDGPHIGQGNALPSITAFPFSSG